MSRGGGRNGDNMDYVHLLIKPSSGMCNLNCKYCFYHDIVEKREQRSYGFMEDDTLERVIEKALLYAKKECTIAFQGGEPTLIGLDFFKKVVELQKKYNRNHVVIHNSIQTNGYGLDGEWADFLRENHFLVGISLDGVKDTHDENRLDPRGNGTFSKIMRTIQLFESRKVEYNILTVVNRQTAKKINKIYNFYKKNGFSYLQFIPCLDPLEEEPGQHPYSLTPKEYGAFLKTLFDLWYQDIKRGEGVSVRQFENYIEMMLGYPPEACGMSGVCGYQHVVEADGSVYPCDFYVLDQYRLGNLKEESLEQVNEKRREIGFVEASRQVDDACKACRWYALCRGGCRRHRPLKADGSLGLNYFCESYRMFFEHTAGRMEELARMVASRQR
jgi:uncharacterized protein